MGWNLGRPEHAVKPLTWSVLGGLQFSYAMCWKMPTAEREERLRIVPAMCDHSDATRLEKENDRGPSIRLYYLCTTKGVKPSAVKVGLD